MGFIYNNNSNNIKYDTHNTTNNKNNNYLNIITSCMTGDKTYEDMEKIITNVSKEILINK